MKIDVDKVVAVYYGKPNECMCGCAGVFSYAKNYTDHKKITGYPADGVTDDINVNRITELLNEFTGNIDIEKGYIHIFVEDNVQYVIYTTKD